MSKISISFHYTIIYKHTKIPNAPLHINLLAWSQIVLFDICSQNITQSMLDPIDKPTTQHYTFKDMHS